MTVFSELIGFFLGASAKKGGKRSKNVENRGQKWTWNQMNRGHVYQKMYRGDFLRIDSFFLSTRERFVYEKIEAFLSGWLEDIWVSGFWEG